MSEDAQHDPTSLARVLCEPEFPLLRMARGFVSHPEGVLPVTCWCERVFLLVPEAKVRAGITGSCGREDCKAAA